ncbi:rhomboid family intramembrane serine protease [Poseidonocella sedimentorum]|uniref:Membrane associated serine protease, rhomboid family n=1 Tax=Poseidonocella sedimentorum TaxID=871652 RepID=A0A1I6DSL0_9RHOB|nr:rhomboid family intramembrane serine protease [Poseidonocella sedimentorum]SFR08318.1 Membrane associated serine protease, rhomboid family [Poseidonocella sedimentorum]
MSAHDPSPVNPLPPIVAALFLFIAGIELVLSLADRGLVGGASGVGWRLGAMQRYGFSNEWMDLMLLRQSWGLDGLKRLVTYAFVHVSFTQALFVGVFVLALGKFVGELFHPLAVLAVFVLSAIGGALIFWLLGPAEGWLIGGFPSAYGLIGAFTFLLWLRAGALGQSQLAAFRLIGILMAIQLAFGLLFGGNPDWIGDVGGFVTGFAVSVFVVPGGFARILDKLRQR